MCGGRCLQRQTLKLTSCEASIPLRIPQIMGISFQASEERRFSLVASHFGPFLKCVRCIGGHVAKSVFSNCIRESSLRTPSQPTPSSNRDMKLYKIRMNSDRPSENLRWENVVKPQLQGFTKFPSGTSNQMIRPNSYRQENPVQTK